LILSGWTLWTLSKQPEELNRTVQGFITKDHSLNDVTVALHKGKDQIGLEQIGADMS
jgi:hypothetical protein